MSSMIVPTSRGGLFSDLIWSIVFRSILLCQWRAYKEKREVTIVLSTYVCHFPSPPTLHIPAVASPCIFPPSSYLFSPYLPPVSSHPPHTCSLLPPCILPPSPYLLLPPPPPPPCILPPFFILPILPYLLLGLIHGQFGLPLLPLCHHQLLPSTVK